MYVISSCPNIDPMKMSDTSKPVAIFCGNYENPVDLAKIYLPNLKKIEDVTYQEYLQKAFGSD